MAVAAWVSGRVALQLSGHETCSALSLLRIDGPCLQLLMADNLDPWKIRPSCRL